MSEKRAKVFVSGCFDLLHSGHVAFLEEASVHGDLHVGIGSDATIYALKGRYPVANQAERLFMIRALRSVSECTVNSGDGLLDFAPDVSRIAPDIFFVNEDGNSPEKEAFCREKGIRYMVSRRIPHGDLPVRSTTALRSECAIPYRIDLAGGWLDQPFVSKHHPGAVLTISIEPSTEFNDRSGMATSTRRVAIRLWNIEIPAGDPLKLAYTLFCCENPPGSDVVSGSQDSLGIVLPGLNRLNYAGGYWPNSVDRVRDEQVLAFVENHLYLVTLEPRQMDFDVLAGTCIDAAGAQRLAEAAEACWQGILARDVEAFGRGFLASFEAQVAMFPHMVDEELRGFIEPYRERSLGCKLSGAGGGGYLILVSREPVPGTLRIRIRR